MKNEDQWFFHLAHCFNLGCKNKSEGECESGGILTRVVMMCKKKSECECESECEIGGILTRVGMMYKKRGVSYSHRTAQPLTFATFPSWRI